MLEWNGLDQRLDRYRTCSANFGLNAIANGHWIVYAEIVKGNPLRAQNVIRYVLNVPGLLGGDKTYDSSELVFAWNSYISKHAWDCPILRTPCIDLNIFKDNGLPRQGTCYFVYKGWNVKRRPELEETEVKGYGPKELSELLNVSEVFYTYDDMTALSDEARLCGCPVVILNEDTDKKELLNENKNGLAYNLSELPQAKETLPKFKDRYLEQYYNEFEKQLLNFLKLTNYGKIKSIKR